MEDSVIKMRRSPAGAASLLYSIRLKDIVALFVFLLLAKDAIKSHSGSWEQVINEGFDIADTFDRIRLERAQEEFDQNGK